MGKEAVTSRAPMHDVVAYISFTIYAFLFLEAWFYDTEEYNGEPQTSIGGRCSFYHYI